MRHIQVTDLGKRLEEGKTSKWLEISRDLQIEEVRSLYSYTFCIRERGSPVNSLRGGNATRAVLTAVNIILNNSNS